MSKNENEVAFLLQICYRYYRGPLTRIGLVGQITHALGTPEETNEYFEYDVNGNLWKKWDALLDQEKEIALGKYSRASDRARSFKMIGQEKFSYESWRLVLSRT